jgi:hypothetical protein
MPASMSPGDRATPSHAPIGLHAEVLDAAQLGLELLDAFADQLEIPRIHHERDPPAVGQMSQRVASDVDHTLGLDRDHSGQDVLGQAQGQLDRVLLDLGHDLGP